LDRAIADALGCGRRAARALLRSSRVRVEGRFVSAADVLAAGDRVTIDAADEHDAENVEREAPADGAVARILWRSPDLLVLDKPAGMHTHRGHSRSSVADQLLRELPEQRFVGASPVEAGLVHRLDRDTSGLVLAATNVPTYARLRGDFAARRVTKRYLALVAGSVAAPFEVSHALARRRTRVVPARRRDTALAALSFVSPLEAAEAWSLVDVAIATGVTHQVRAHLSLAGHPVLGAVKYGGPPAPSATRLGQLLHAFRIVLGDELDVAVGAPADFSKALWILRGAE
jgi:23S rRNA pseudouridine1911/1915/1917 synthase